MNELAVLLKTPLTAEQRTKRDKIRANLRATMRSFYLIGAELSIYRDEALYREDHKTFEEFVEKEFAMERAQAYRLMESAKVVKTLTEAIGDRLVLPENERQTRELKVVPAEKQAEAWEEAVLKSGGKAPTAGVIQKVAARFKKSAIKHTPPVIGWSKEVLKDDEELAEAFARIEKVYGKQDTAAIQQGAIETIRRPDVLMLSNLPPAKMEEVRNLIMGNHWKPSRALEFVNDMPNSESTLEDMQNWCLSTKGMFFTATIGGFEHTVKATRAARR